MPPVYTHYTSSHTLLDMTVGPELGNFKGCHMHEGLHTEAIAVMCRTLTCMQLHHQSCNAGMPY